MKYLIQNIFDGKIEINEASIPKLNNNEVLIKTIYSLISSGTERSLIEFGKSNILKKIKDNKERVGTVIDKIKNDGLITTLDLVEKKINKPIQIGYSNLGIVVESNSPKFKKGDKVISNGFHSEYVKVGHNLCVQVPGDVDDKNAVFSILGSIALNGIRKLNIQLDENIIIFGFGLIGNIASKILKANGVNIIIVDIDESKRQDAEKNGFIFCNPKKDNLENLVAQNTKNFGCDSALICSNSKDSEPIVNAAKVVRKLGKIVLVGEANIELPRKIFYEKEIKFEVSKSYGPGRYDYNYEKLGLDYPFEHIRWTENRNIETIVNLLKKKALNFEDLVYEIFELEEFKKAYEVITSKKTHKAVLFKYGSNKDHKENIKKEKKTLQSSSSYEISAIGAGNHSLSILFPIFKKKSDFGYICADSPSNISHSLKKFGFKDSIENEDDLFNNNNIKNLIVTTPHDMHSNALIKSIKYNKNIFLEKPAAINSSEIEEIKRAIDISDNLPIIRINYNRRHSSYCKIIKSKLLNKNVRKSIQINVNTTDYTQSNNWLSDTKRSGGIIIGEACHFIDLSKFFIEEEIVNSTINKSKNSDFQITLNFKDDSCAQINYFFSGTKKFPKENIKIFSDGDVIEIDNFKSFKSHKKGIKSNFFSKQDKGHENSIDDFLKKIKGERKQILDDILNDIDTAKIAITLSNNVE